MTVFKIFPATLIGGQKVPLIKGWQQLASNDPKQIEEWTKIFRDRITFWGIPCGETNGIFAVDIDVKKVNGFESLKALGYTYPNTLYQKTPSGGAHLIFRAEPGVKYPNTVNQKLGIDTRGDGGWIAHYKFENEDTPPAIAPSWTLMLAPRQAEVLHATSLVRYAPESVQGILTESLDKIRTAASGESNNILNVESFKIGQLVASEALPREIAEVELFKAAKARGKGDYEAKATIKSGLDGGMKNPLTCPFSPGAPVVTIDIPDAPPPPQRWTPKPFTKYDLFNMQKLRKPQLFEHWSTEDIQITTADGGTGKTTMKLYEAICMALGDRFLGFECKSPGGRTLFITGEDSEAKLQAIMGQILIQMGYKDNEEVIQKVVNSIAIKKDSDLCLTTKTRDGVIIPNPLAMTKVREAIEDFQPRMIVWDPISSFWGSEMALNDMNRAVNKFMSEIVENWQISNEMINHMGKASSQNKEMGQFAGRGGSGLPSNARVSRVLRGIDSAEYKESTGEDLPPNTTAMLCQVNKFTDGSPLLNKPFIILRQGYLFTKKIMTPAKSKEFDNKLAHAERIFNYIREHRQKDLWIGKSIIIDHFMHSVESISEAQIKRSLGVLQAIGHLGEKIREIPNPDQTITEKAFTIVDQDGNEI